jgi:hypothetical protein
MWVAAVMGADSVAAHTGLRLLMTSQPWSASLSHDGSGALIGSPMGSELNTQSGISRLSGLLLAWAESAKRLLSGCWSRRRDPVDGAE